MENNHTLAESSVSSISDAVNGQNGKYLIMAISVIAVVGLGTAAGVQCYAMKNGYNSTFKLFPFSHSVTKAA